MFELESATKSINVLTDVLSKVGRNKHSIFLLLLNRKAGFSILCFDRWKSICGLNTIRGEKNKLLYGKNSSHLFGRRFFRVGKNGFRSSHTDLSRIFHRTTLL